MKIYRKKETGSFQHIETLSGSSYTDKVDELGKNYTYELRNSGGSSLSNEVTVKAEVIVVLVRGYSAFGNGVNSDYWKVPDKWKNKGLIDDDEGVKGWLEGKGITCWDASSVLNGTHTVQANSGYLETFLNTKRTGDYANCKIYLFGHSMGGLISRQFANDNPGIVKKIFCAQTPHTGSPLAEIRGLWPDNAATYSLLPTACSLFNNSVDIGDTDLYSTYSSNSVNVCSNVGLIATSGIILAQNTNPINSLRYFPNTSDGAVPSESARGRFWQTTTVQMAESYDSNLDHYSCYRHPDTLNKVMEWFGYPQAAPLLDMADSMQSLDEPGPEVTPLYFIAGFSGLFDSSQPVSETVNIGTSQKAYFRANVSDPNCVFTITNPNAVVINSALAGTDPNIIYNKEDGIQSYEVIAPLVGAWTLNITTLLSDPNSVEYGLTAFEDQFITFTVYGEKDWTNTGVSMLLMAELLDNSGAITGATVTADVTLPDETVQSITLFDDGTNGDNTASDGIYSYIFTSTSLEGTYSIYASASGTTSTASTFERTATFSFTATPADIVITGLVSDEGVDTNLNSYFDILRFNIPVSVSVEKDYRLTASLIDSNLDTISLLNSGELSLATDANSISVEVIAEDIVKNNIAGPYTLQNIEISDVYTGLVIADANDFMTAAYQLSDFEPLDSDKDGLSDNLELSIGTDINLADSDFDGVSDYDEVAYDGDASSYNPLTDLNPISADSDSDGMDDGWEINFGFDPLIDDGANNNDNDSDGLLNLEEFENSTLPNNSDTDGDGISDGDEIDVYATNPINIDTDSDGLIDGDELSIYGTIPTNPDTDEDGVLDGIDNCKLLPNSGQSDLDNDAIGDICDSCPNDMFNDIDSDGICGDVDNCPIDENATQENSDSDSLGDICDNCPNNDNEDQNDMDSDGKGDLCDILQDLNNDNFIDYEDFALFSSHWFETGCIAPDFCTACDFDKSGNVGIEELVLFAGLWLEDVTP